MDIKTILQETNGGQAIFEWYEYQIGKNILSPLNSADTKPSFRIYRCKRDKKFKYYDFGDGAHGDAIDFVAGIENITTKKAINLISKILMKNQKNGDCYCRAEKPTRWFRKKSK